MSYLETKTADAEKQLLSSAVGYVAKTRGLTFTSTCGITTAEGRKLIPAGAIWPSNDANAAGIVPETVDVTDETRIAPLIVAGRIDPACLPTAPSNDAKAALAAQGIVFESRAAAERA